MAESYENVLVVVGLSLVVEKREESRVDVHPQLLRRVDSAEVLLDQAGVDAYFNCEQADGLPSEVDLN